MTPEITLLIIIVIVLFLIIAVAICTDSDRRRGSFLDGICFIDLDFDDD